MADPTFHLHTPRLQLTHLLPTSPEHADFLVELWNTPLFIASIGGKPTSITTREAAKGLIENRFVKEYERNRYGTFLVSLLPPQPSTDEAAATTTTTTTTTTEAGTAEAGALPIGTISLSKGHGPHYPTIPDLGFAILPTHSRKGYATEAAEAVLEWYESVFHTREVLGLHDERNRASRGMFEKLGFVEVGVRELRMFGEGVEGVVWVREGMSLEVGRYGI